MLSSIKYHKKTFWLNLILPWIYCFALAIHLWGVSGGDLVFVVLAILAALIHIVFIFIATSKDEEQRDAAFYGFFPSALLIILSIFAIVQMT
jgi:membrane protein YdbS with pleckstrin-like domain